MAQQYFCFIWLADKQQEIDLPAPKADDAEGGGMHTKKEKKKTPMSHIMGVRKLKHTNSFTGVVPKYGVEVSNEEEVSKVCIW